jgi:PAS domain S-box-containing protein
LAGDTLQDVEDQIRFHARMLSAVKMAIIATRPDGQIIYWNPFAEELYGWPAEEVLGHSILDITVPTGSEQAAAEIMAALNAGQSWTGEFVVKRKDGTPITASVSDSPIFDDDGRLIAIVGVSHDLTALNTARAELEHQVEERTAELKTANANLGDLSARLMLLRDEEARRIARDLHDSVGQLLAAIGINISVVKQQSHKLNAAGARAVSENQALVAEIDKEIRSLSYLLHPPLLDDLGLVTALQIYADGYSARSNIKVDLAIPPDFGRLSSDLEIGCFRIVQECLTNIHRHSKSATAAISIRHGDGRILVEVRDKGQGIAPARLSELTSSGGAGVGLSGMQERVKQLGGTLKVESSANGTAVFASLPLKHSITAA